MLHQVSIVLCVLSTTVGMVIQEPRTLTLGGRPNLDFGKCPEVRIVQNFQTDQFLGDWYASYANPTWFQSELTTCSRARYTLNNDGTVGVFNSGTNPSGKYEEICGFAAQPYPNEGALEVVFFSRKLPENPTPNYLILGTDYTSYATIYSCSQILGIFRSQEGNSIGGKYWLNP